MSEEWELTDEDYRIVDTSEFNDPESEEYPERIANAARRTLLEWLKKQGKATLDEHGHSQAGIFIPGPQWQALLYAHGLAEPVGKESAAT